MVSTTYSQKSKHALGGIDKARILTEFKPHIFFDDQVAAIENASAVTPSAHVPFGIANKAAEIVKAADEASDSQPKP